MRRLSNQVRFIRAVRARQLDLTRKAAVIEAQLDAEGYDRLLPPKAARKVRVVPLFLSLFSGFIGGSVFSGNVVRHDPALGAALHRGIHS